VHLHEIRHILFKDTYKGGKTKMTDQGIIIMKFRIMLGAGSYDQGETTEG
jgi:hypothetical protein